MKKLGLGLMRLPMNGQDVDIERTKEMVDEFISKGFTYFDTAYVYHNQKSEGVAKTTLVERYPRESFQLATKLPIGLAESREDVQKLFDTSLERSGAGYFDYYLLHSINAQNIEKFDRLGGWEFLQEIKQKGLAKNVGFSFHDSAEMLDDLLAKHPEVDFVQLQLNYIDWESDAVQSRKCYEVARKHNKPIIVMEPVKGGSLASMPDDIAKPLLECTKDASLASWAMRWVASLDGVFMVLSGMSDMDQINDNVKTFDALTPLSPDELVALDKTIENINNCDSIPCTICNYCVKGCPVSINIPQMFRAANTAIIYKNFSGAQGTYNWVAAEGGVPADCIECGQCEDVCPQHISIIEELKKVESVIGL